MVTVNQYIAGPGSISLIRELLSWEGLPRGRVEELGGSQMTVKRWWVLARLLRNMRVFPDLGAVCQRQGSLRKDSE